MCNHSVIQVGWLTSGLDHQDHYWLRHVGGGMARSYCGMQAVIERLLYDLTAPRCNLCRVIYDLDHGVGYAQPTP